MEENLYQKLAKIRKLVEVIKKNKKGFGYTYLSIEEILARVTAGMTKYHISLIPSFTEDAMTVTQNDYVRKKALKDGTLYDDPVHEIIVFAPMVFTWVNDDNPEERISVRWNMVGSQSDPSQAFGSGMTYATRYFLDEYFQISKPDSDPDEWRSKQREAAQAEDKEVAAGIIEKAHGIVTEFVTAHPDQKQAIIDLTKQYAKDEKGRATANYYAIEDPVVASKYLEALVRLIEGDAAKK